MVLATIQSKSRANVVNDRWLLTGKWQPNSVKASYPVANSGSIITGISASTKDSRNGPCTGDMTTTNIPSALHHLARCDTMIGAPLRVKSCEISKTFRSELLLTEFLRANIRIGSGESRYNQSRMLLV